MFRSMDQTKTPVFKTESNLVYNVPQDIYDGTRETFTMYSASTWSPSISDNYTVGPAFTSLIYGME